MIIFTLDPSEGGLEKGFFGGAIIGCVVGCAIAGPLGGIAGIIIGSTVGGLTVVVIDKISETMKEKAEAQARAKLDEEQRAFILEFTSKQAQQEAKEAELASQSVALEQKSREVKATKEAIELRERKVEEKEHKAKEVQRRAEESQQRAEGSQRKAEARQAIVDQKLITLAVQKINAVKDYIKLMQEGGHSLEVIKHRLKTKPSFSDVFFEDDLRDAKTDAVLDDCVKAPDGYYYNRSTLVEIYKQAQEEKREAKCFKDPSKRLLDPATLPTDQNFRAKIQILRQAGLVEGLSLSSLPNPTGSKVVTKNPTLIEDVSMTPQADPNQKKRFLRAPEGYCAFFIPEQESVPSANAQPSLTAGELVDVAVVVERQATEWISV